MTAKSHNSSKLRKALFPGTFDPFTTGHLDILRRGLELFDGIIVAIGYNPSKTTAEDVAARKEAIERILKGDSRIEVTAYTTLTVDEAVRTGASAILRGIRTTADFEYEKSLAEVNRKISGIETVLLVSSPEFSMVSSTLVRELRSFGHDVSEFLPPAD